MEDRALTDWHQRAYLETIDYRMTRFEVEITFLSIDDFAVEVDPLDEFRGRNERLGELELKRLLELIGFEGDGLRSAWAISMKESSGRPLAYNGNRSTGDSSYGLFQINMIGRLGPVRREAFGLEENAELFDPVLNAQIAYEMSKEGTDFGHWGIGPNAYTGGRPGSYPYWLTQFPEEG